MKHTTPAYRGAVAGIVACLLVMWPLTAFAQTPSTWSKLEPGQHTVGFTTVELKDDSRTMRPSEDYFGDPLDGETVRMLQVCLWYPSLPSDQPKMFYGEYHFPSPNDVDFFDYVTAMQNKDIRRLAGFLRPAGGDLNDVLNLPMYAVRDASVKDGQFPLLIYHSDHNSSYCDNVVLCEYLASHGFVVASTHAVGLNADGSPFSQKDIETQVHDLELAVSNLHGRENIDFKRCGLIGCGTGATVAMAYQMRNYDIDIVAAIDPAFATVEGWKLLEDNPFFDCQRMKLPLLCLFRSDAEDYHAGFSSSLTYSDRYLMGHRGLIPANFTAHGSMMAEVMGAVEAPPGITHFAHYNQMSANILAFCSDILNPDPAQSWPDQPLAERLKPLENIDSWTYLQAEDAPPTRAEFARILQVQGPATAIEVYEKFHAKDSTINLFDEGFMNGMGYRALRGGDLENAVRLFKMNAYTYPGSANCWDSYSECLVALGRNEEAVVAAKRVLEALPDDPRLTEDFRQQLKELAENRLAELGAN